jgi:cold shock CspA family protein
MPYQRPQGTLAFWNQNGYGWLDIDGFPSRSHQVFVHRTAFEQAGIEPRVGIRLAFDVKAGTPSRAETRKHEYRIAAINLTPIDAPAQEGVR